MKDTQPEMIIVDSLDEIPRFANEDEEREWWATHELSEQLYERLEDTSSELDQILPLTKPKAKPRRGSI
jgi:hypothetical protein